MEHESIDKLQGDPKNPRILSKHDGDALKQSMQRFGDISCIVFNRRSGVLVAGHQRMEIIRRMPGNKRLVIDHRYDAPDSEGTTAIGKVWVENRPFAYREVDWDEPTQHAANIAANRIQGEFDKDLLAEMTYELSQLENADDLLALTGQTDDEVDKLINMVAGEPDILLPDGDKPGFQTMSFTLSDEQAAVVNEAIGFIKQHKSFEGMENQNGNGNALYFVAREFMDYTNGLIEK